MLTLGKKGKYFTAVVETEKENIDLLVLDLNERTRFKRAAKQRSKVQLKHVDHERLGVRQGKLGLKFTQKSAMTFKKKLAFDSNYCTGAS